MCPELQSHHVRRGADGGALHGVRSGEELPAADRRQTRGPRHHAGTQSASTDFAMNYAK